MSLHQLFREAFPHLQISEQASDKWSYCRDLWPKHHMTVRSAQPLTEWEPSLIVWPKSTEDVSAIVRLCAQEGVQIVPFGAGSGVCAGILPNKQTVVLDLKAMQRWRALDPDSPTLDVEAGALGITLEERLQRKGWTIGHFPSSILCSTVGGWLAARGAGQCSGKYGKIEDMVSEVELVDGRGDVHTWKRRIYGPDLIPIIIGSEGTLGVITSAKMRLHPNPTIRAFSAFSFPTIEHGWTAMRRMFQAGLRPAVARLYDPFDSYMAKQGSVKKVGSEKKSKDDGPTSLGHALRFSQTINSLVDSPLGTQLFGGSTLVIIFEGTGPDVWEDSERATQLCQELEGTALGEGPARKWFQHRYSVSYRNSTVYRAGLFADTMEVAAPWSRLQALYDNVRGALGGQAFVMAHLSHAYPDGCCIYFTMAGRGQDEADSLRRYEQAWSDAMQAALDAGGTLSHHHGVGRSKASRVPAELGQGIWLLRAAKAVLDPHGIFNLGSVVPEGELDLTPAGPPGEQEFHIDQESCLATLPGTMTLGESINTLQKQGFTLPLGTGYRAEQSVAQWMATGTPARPDPWNDPADHLIAGFRATLPAERGMVDLRPVPRRAVGPDLISWFVGTEGRFGTIQAVDLRVLPQQNESARTLPFQGERQPSLSSSENMVWDGMATWIHQ
jgi:alkyldihydroxyacetonephosphate synthase